jgi:hypothetical protein
MSDIELTEKQLRRREANIRYREKLKNESKKHEHEKPEKPCENHEESCEKHEESCEKHEEPCIEESCIEEPCIEDVSEDSYVLDKKTYMYLLEKAKQQETAEEKPRKTEDKPEEPKPTTDQPTFFQLVGNSFKATAVSLIPILTIQAMMHGGKLLTNLKPSSPSKSISPPSNPSRTQPTQDFVLPSVNYL